METVPGRIALSFKPDGVRRIYNILFSFFFVISAPYYFLKMWRRGGWREGFNQRFGYYSSRVKQALTNRHVLWIHAVSVGEANICTQLISVLESRVPNMKIVVSTTTSTGMGELRRRLPHHIETIYYPVDHARCVARALRVINPEAVVLVEAEIWPNFLWRTQDKGIPVFLVNARMSERSHKGYKRFGSLFTPLFASFAGVGVQNQIDADGMCQLGCSRDAVKVVGNLKFDAARLFERPLINVSDLLKQLGVNPGALVLLGGSTHAGEEAVLADLFLRLRPRFPDLFLILVPRHFERGKEVGKELTDRRLRFVYRTAIGTASRFEPGEVDCLLVNTTGELKYFYAAASVIFVGKSLVGVGGQNPIEPGAMGKAIIFGPNMQNFDSVAKAFVKQQGAVQITNAVELEREAEKLLSDSALREKLGANALKVVSENQGSLERTSNMIIARLKSEEIYVAGNRESV